MILREKDTLIYIVGASPLIAGRNTGQEPFVTVGRLLVTVGCLTNGQRAKEKPMMA